MRGTDQYKQVSNKPFGDRTGRLALEWGSRGRRFESSHPDQKGTDAMR